MEKEEGRGSCKDGPSGGCKGSHSNLTLPRRHLYGGKYEFACFTVSSSGYSSHTSFSLTSSVLSAVLSLISTFFILCIFFSFFFSPQPALCPFRTWGRGKSSVGTDGVNPSRWRKAKGRPPSLELHTALAIIPTKKREPPR